MGDLALLVLTVFSVAVGAYYLGRSTQKDRIEFLLDELEAATSITDDLLRLRQQTANPRLRVVRGEE